jgi:IMP dehydrogenase
MAISVGNIAFDRYLNPDNVEQRGLHTMNQGLTFDDVLLVPQYSEIRSRSDVSLKTKLTKNIQLNMPFISSNMDTVTEHDMAIAMAKNGGIGIIHRYCSIAEQATMVERVKRSYSFMINTPYTIPVTSTVADYYKMKQITSVKSFPIISQDNRLFGLITNRDVVGRTGTTLITDCMTPRIRLVTADPDINRATAQEMMIKHKIQKLPVVTPDNRLLGLICFNEHNNDSNISRDRNGNLLVGAAIGVKEDSMLRARALVRAGVDLLVIDIAHGHSIQCIETIQNVKREFPNIDLIAGNIATADGALELIKAGADGIKCGIGNGSICSTRIVAGSGVPQLTALMEVAPVCKKYGIPLISDGGNRNSGNICKALAAGANTVMLGRLIAGCDESPSPVVSRDGKKMKMIRGMAGVVAQISNAHRQNLPSAPLQSPQVMHVEGVEGYVPYAGSISGVLNSLASGIRSGMSYSGAPSIPILQDKHKFIRITKNGNIESGIHDIS